MMSLPWIGVEEWVHALTNLQGHIKGQGHLSVSACFTPYCNIVIISQLGDHTAANSYCRRRLTSTLYDSITWTTNDRQLKHAAFKAEIDVSVTSLSRYVALAGFAYELLRGHMHTSARTHRLPDSRSVTSGVSDISLGWRLDFPRAWKKTCVAWQIPVMGNCEVSSRCPNRNFVHSCI